MKRRYRIALVVYPLAFGAMAINVFFASLMLSFVQIPVAPLGLCLVLGAILGLPASYFFGRHIDKLMIQADSDS